MIRLANNWYITLADLSLILFMVAGHAVTDNGPAAAVSSTVAGNPLPAEGEPVAVYRAGADAPAIARWLQGQLRDDRLRLTVIGHYAGGDAGPVTARAAALAAEARQQGAQARILVEPAPADEVLAVLSYDRAPDWHGDCTAVADKGHAPGKDNPCD